jgi:hypothetical protein
MAVALLGAVAACGARDEGERRGAEGGAAAAEELVGSLLVQVGEERVRLVLNVTNAGGGASVLEFPTMQRYDFAIESADGGEVWRWSEGRMFAQALGTEQLGPGETLRYEEEWDHGGRRGRYTAVATLASTSHALEQRADFEIE